MAYVITGSPRWEKEIRQFGFDEKASERFGKRLHKTLIEFTRNQFETFGAAGGTPWPGYDAQERKYAAMKRAILGLTGNIDHTQLRWPGGTEKLFPSFIIPANPFHVWKTEITEWEYGSSLIYAQRHQDGEGVGPFGEPVAERQMLVLTKLRVDRMRGEMAEELNIGKAVPGGYVA